MAVPPADRARRAPGETPPLGRGSAARPRRPRRASPERSASVRWAAAADDLAEGPGQLGRIGRDAVVEADGPAVLPGVAEMEGEPGRELAPAPPPEIVLAHVEHPRAELRSPDMCVEETALGRETLPVEHQRRKDEHQVIGRDREVVDHAERRHGNLADTAGLPAASIR